MCAASQCVSIELSVSWKRDSFVFKSKENTYCYPSLEITYRNNSLQPLYFLKVLHPYNGLPRTFYLIHVLPQNRANLPLNCDNTGENYTVCFDDVPAMFNQTWYILSDSTYIEGEYEVDFVNDDLYRVYQNVFDTLSNESVFSPNHRVFFKESDFIFEEYPEEVVKNQFVFLKPGESYIDTVNLIGFLLVGGNYTFRIKDDCLKSYVLGASRQDVEKEIFIETRIPLPPYIKEYKLYDGEIRTNEVRICLKKETKGKKGQ